MIREWLSGLVSLAESLALASCALCVSACWAHGEGGARASLTGGTLKASASADLSASAKASGEAEAEAKTEIEVHYNKRLRQIVFPHGVILFELDKDTLKDDDKTAKTLVTIHHFLASHPKVQVRIEGHTDSRASDDYNLDLSDRRAATVRQWFIDNDIDPDRMTSVGKGELAPKVAEGDCKDGKPDAPEDCEERVWSKNRRVELHVTGGAETIAEPTPAPKPKPPPAPPEPPPEPPHECPLLVVGYLNALGPNALGGAMLALQFPHCWLELGVSVGLNYGMVSVETADAAVWAFPMLMRGRVWFLNPDGHSPIFDLGLGAMQYFISGDGGNYNRRGPRGLVSFGAGYGYRSSSFWRFTALVGTTMQFGDLAQGDYSGNASSRDTLDNISDELSFSGFPLKGSIAPFLEGSFGVTF